MITIEAVRQYLDTEDSVKSSLAELCNSQYEEISDLRMILREVEHLSGAERGNLCARIIHMKDEIERLRAELQNERNWHKALKPCPQALLDAVDEAYEKAAQTCELEVVDYEASKHPEDLAYNKATEHCADAIRKLKSGEPK